MRARSTYRRRQTGVGGKRSRRQIGSFRLSCSCRNARAVATVGSPLRRSAVGAADAWAGESCSSRLNMQSSFVTVIDLTLPMFGLGLPFGFRDLNGGIVRKNSLCSGHVKPGSIH